MKIISFSCIFWIGGFVFSQTVMTNNKAKTDVTDTKYNVTNSQTVNRTVNPNSVVIGNTKYDFHYKKSALRTIINNGNGKISVVFNYSNYANNSSNDRGTAYNHYDGNSWGPIPSSRLETSRHGFPCVISNGTNEIIFSHQNSETSNNNENGIKMLSRNIAGTGNWTETLIKTKYFSNHDVFYPTAAIGGTNDSTIHLLAYAWGNDTTFRIPGFNRYSRSYAMLYYRSSDLGVTWDIKDSILPAFDSSIYNYHEEGAYQIDANENNVSIAYFGQLESTKVITSNDNGNTWSENTIINFPNRYRIDDGIVSTPKSNFEYTPYEYLTTDHSGSLIIDNNGKSHIAFSTIYVDDSDLNDNQYFGVTIHDGLAYWNSDFGDDSIQIIARHKDYNNDSIIDEMYPSGNYFQYNYSGHSSLSMPSMGISSDNKIYITYSALSEVHFDGVNNFRHIYVIMSNDSGANWTNPKDFTPDFNFNLTENVYPSLAKNVDENLHIIYQEDNTPGSHVTQSSAPVNTSDIIYMKLDTALNEAVLSSKELSSLDFKIFPNPTTNSININLNSGTKVTGGKICNINGVVIKNIREITEEQSKSINLSSFRKGVYYILLDFESGRKLSKKFIKL